MALFGGFLQSTFAAVSFTGAGYLLKMFEKNGYEKEMAQLQKAKD